MQVMRKKAAKCEILQRKIQVPNQLSTFYDPKKETKTLTTKFKELST